MQEIRKAGTIPQHFLDFINQVFEIEKKANQLQEVNSIQRNVNKLKDLFENEFFKNHQGSSGLSYLNPIGEVYNDSRTDCDVSISGTSIDNLKIIEVIKPIIYYSYIDDEKIIKTIVQKGIVVAESTN